MFCKNCGNNIPDGTNFCQNCGCPLGQGTNNCANCGAELAPEQAFCANCGTPVAPVAQPVNMEKGPSKMLCGFMGIFLGAYGVHHFIMGYKGRGVRNIILSACSLVSFGITGIIAGIFGIVDGIKIFRGVINTDAHGRKLS